MKKIAIVFILPALLLCCAVVLIACGGGNNNNNNTVFETSQLNAQPIAPTGGNPKILDSYTDGLSNYYLLDVGHVKDVYISTLAQVYYTGVPLSFSKTTTSTEQITESLTKTISDSFYSSLTSGTKVGISFAQKETIPGVAEFTTTQSFEWSWTGTSSVTNTKSTANTTTTASTFAELQTISYSFGTNSAPEGRYRYAIYSTIDVYYLITTSLNNQSLIGWEVVACARPNDYFLRTEYSSTGIYSNSPNDDITFAEDFYTNLSNPSANMIIHDFSNRSNYSDLGELTITSTENNIMLIGDSAKLFTMTVVIVNRSNDLFITMNNINFVAPNGTAGTNANGKHGSTGSPAIKDISENANSHTVHIKVMGHVEISGGDGGVGVDGTPGSSGNRFGGNGGNGGCGIDLGVSSIRIYGTGNIKIAGGNGGRGGNATETQNGTSKASTRYGGHGGVGAAAIYCDSATFYSTTSTLNVALNGGNGGNGGKGGNAANSSSTGGGNGGNGGNAGYPLQANTLYRQTVIPVAFLTGAGGIGGQRGEKSLTANPGKAGIDGIPSSQISAWWSIGLNRSIEI